MRTHSFFSAARSRVAALVCAVTSVFAVAAPAAAQQPLQLNPMPIEAIARLPAMQSVRLSPDGRHIVSLVAVEGQRWPVVQILNLETGNAVQIPSREMRPRSVGFLGNDRVIFFADQPFTYGNYRTFTVQAWVADLEGRNIENPFRARGAMADTERELERFGFNFGTLQEGSIQNPHRYLFTRDNLSTGASEVLALDTRTMRVERVARAGDDEGYILADEVTGELMVKQSIEFTGGNWVQFYEIRNRQTGAWERHPEFDVVARDRISIEPLGFPEADRNKLYVSTNRNSNFAQIQVYDIATRTWEAEPAFASNQFDMTNYIGGRDVETGELLGALGYSISGPDIQQVFVEGQWAPVMQVLQRQFPGRTVSLSDRRSRLNVALVTVDGPRHPPAYFLIRNGNRLDTIGSSMPWVNPDQMGQASFLYYTARDGMRIPAILTLPPGYNRETHGRIPVVVHPHGGPWARDFMGWDSSGWTQFMATRGYAVIQPQYRGSNGLGMELWKAGDQQWGLKMQDDKDDAAQHLVNEGIGDPNRMAIFGYSYGGFAAIAASVRPNSPYRCALAGAGVADIDRLALLWGASRVAREFQGWTVDGMNPIENVQNANIPILLYHGNHDRQADTVHSRDFYAAMRAAGKEVVYHEIDTMWHQLPWWPEWHRETLGYIEDWLAGPRCFGGATAAEAPAANASGF